MKTTQLLIRGLQLALLSVCMLSVGGIVGWQAAQSEDVCVAVAASKIKGAVAHLRGKSNAEKAMDEVVDTPHKVLDRLAGSIEKARESAKKLEKAAP